jgi:D-cysteine desulfhydrase
MQADGLLDALARVPRRSLGAYPTPLDRLENLSRELGREVFVKRDDALGPAGGGNKTRKLEYLLADAVEAGAERIVTVGGPQSNHARMTAAAARVVGLEPHLLLFGDKPKRAVANLLLDELLDAELHFIPPGPIEAESCTFSELDAFVREQARERVGEHYHVPLGGSNGLGSVGYIRAALEIDEQAKEAGIGDGWIVEGRSAVLRAPSAIVPAESNFLLNPSHSDFGRIEFCDPVRFTVDPRLVGALSQDS